VGPHGQGPHGVAQCRPQREVGGIQFQLAGFDLGKVEQVAMREVYKAIGRVAAQNVPVLITGEGGTGKELVARTIYQHGPRAKAPFLALNCAAIPEQLRERAIRPREGRF
jgi:DNA-binding NtrC family response regulator